MRLLTIVEKKFMLSICFFREKAHSPPPGNFIGTKASLTHLLNKGERSVISGFIGYFCISGKKAVAAPHV